MQATSTAPLSLNWAVLIGTAIVVPLFLYYIDEGRYSLEGLFTVGNGIAMGIYLTGMALGLLLMARLFAKRKPGPLRTALVLSLGSMAGLLFALLLIAGIGLIQYIS